MPFHQWRSTLTFIPYSSLPDRIIMILDGPRARSPIWGVDRGTYWHKPVRLEEDGDQGDETEDTT
jgi:hypothetical protein